MRRRPGPLPLVLLLLATTAAAKPPAWRPQDADLLFMSARTGNAEVYVLRAGGVEWTNLTNHESVDNWPVWSPDGRRIAFQSRRAGNLDVWVMDADGSGPVRLTTHDEPDYLPSWSPDGRSILFTSWRRDSADTARAPHVYVMNADGTDQRRLVAQSLNTSSGATWSPDGSAIAYTRKPGELGADLFVADRDGRNERRLTNDHARNVYNGSPEFSPDGRWIAFYSDDTTHSALHVIGVDGRNRRTVLATGQNWYPRWSPDSKWLVYTAEVEGQKGNIDLFAIPVSGRARPVRLVGGPKREQEGSWRPAP